MNYYKISITNTYSYLHTNDITLKNQLHSLLRFKQKGAFFNPLYRQGVWDGYKDFFTHQGRFLTGLLPEIKLFLKKKNIEYTIEDSTSNKSFNIKEIDKNYIKKEIKHELYDYQVDLINQFIKFKRGIIKAPTSAGKTNIMFGILKSIPKEYTVLFLAKNSSLVNQIYKDLVNLKLEGVGRWYGDYKETGRMICATSHKQTYISLDKFIRNVDVLIVDEIHENMSEVPMKAFNKMENASIRLAISATPFKDDGQDLSQKYLVKGYFGPVLKTTVTENGEITTKELQDRNILSKSICTFYKINTPNLEHEPYQDAVTLGISNNYDFLLKVRDLAKTLKGRTLILTERIEQGELLKTLLPEAHWIQGKNTIKEREPVLQSLREDENCLVISMQHIITSGINVFIQNLINCSGGKASHSIIQRFGRGLRKAKDKTILNYYDFIFDMNHYLYKHSLSRVKILKKEGHEIVIKDDWDIPETKIT